MCTDLGTDITVCPPMTIEWYIADLTDNITNLLDIATTNPTITIIDQEHRWQQDGALALKETDIMPRQIE